MKHFHEFQRLQGVIQQLELDVDSQHYNRLQKTNYNITNDRYTTLLGDFQNAIIKGTKEAVERVSLTAQVRGLQGTERNPY